MPPLNEHVARLITVRYWVALALVAAMVTAAQIVMSRTVEMERSGFRIVGMAAQQSFAAQRICFLSHAVVSAGDPETRQIYRKRLDEAVREMEKHHLVLSLRKNAQSIPAGMRSILKDAYYRNPETFDQKVNELLQDARTIVAAADDDLALGMEPLTRLTNAGSDPVVDKQRQIFERLKVEARGAVDRIRMLGTMLWLATLLLLAATVPLIFRPMARRASESMGRIESARRQAEQAAVAAQAAREGQASFVRTMSHELRTPLNAILGMTQLMKMGINPDKQAEYAQDIHQAGRHLLGLINDVLEFSRLEAGQVAIEPVRTVLKDELEWTVSLLRPLAEEKGLQLTYWLEPGLAHAYLADGPRIRQVLFNLVGNALKFTNEGFISLIVTYGGSAGEDSDLVRFEVRDTGIGVPAELQQRIFEEFQQADNALAREHGGSGLGLAISTRLVKLMNGEIGVESREAGGSIFWFALPLRWIAEPGARQPAAPEGVPPLRLRVLVAEADPVHRSRLEHDLRGMGHEAETVATGCEAVFAVTQSPPDVVMMDINLSETDGISAIRGIRALPGPAAGLFIIAMTASTERALIERIMGAGADIWLGKPVNTGALHDRLSEFGQRGPA
jgi:signal transduction histidine kinase